MLTSGLNRKKSVQLRTEALITKAFRPPDPFQSGRNAWNFSSLIPGLILVIAILVASSIFLYPNYQEFPMDDTYIHFVYARNLADQGRLFFNHPGEQGLGTSSFVWVLFLAAGDKLGLSLHLLAKTIGILSLATVSGVCFHLLRSFLSARLAIFAALLVALSGNLLWFALSGMETMLFLAIGSLALLAYQRERWVMLGILIGLLTLTRPEGLILGGAIALAELVRLKRITRGIIYSGTIAILLCGPWFAYLRWRTGHFLPTSAIGKIFSQQVALEYALEHHTALAGIASFSAIIYVGLWITYLLTFSLGGMSLPSPHIPIGAVIGFENYTISVWAIFAWGVILFLLYRAYARIKASNRWAVWMQSDALRPVIVLLIWAIMHNIVYMVFLPLPGTASRYGAINYLILWIAVVIGLSSISASFRGRGLMAGVVMIVVAANTSYWNQVYDANILHMENVRIKSAYFLREISKNDVRCAVSDIGAIRYYSQKPILDLGALVDPEAKQWFLEGAIDRYILDHDVNCLVLPGRSGTLEEGWLDMADLLGLSTSDLFETNQVAVFEIDRELWLRGYLPTNNYQASVVIYQINPKNQLESPDR